MTSIDRSHQQEKKMQLRRRGEGGDETNCNRKQKQNKELLKMKDFNNINEQALNILSAIRFMVENDNYTPEEWKNKAETDKERIERIVDYWRQLNELVGESGEYWDCGSCDSDMTTHEWERFCEVFDETKRISEVWIRRHIRIDSDDIR